MEKIDFQTSYMVLLEKPKFIVKFWQPQKITSLVWVGFSLWGGGGGVKLDGEKKEQ